MGKRFIKLISAVGLVCFSFAVLKAQTVKIILAGDSTVASYSPEVRPLTGWGEVLPYCFDKQVKIINYASSGASTSTFRSWGKWKKVMSAARKGDYVFIQLGHNDEKTHNIKKYADPDTTYQENLKRFIKEVREKGAIPILITPPVRLIYNANGKLKETHVQSLWHAPKGTRETSTTYPDAMRKVATDTGVTLLDLNSTSKVKIEALPSKKEAETYYRFVKPGHKNYPKGIKDTTHFSTKGAALMAICVANEIRRLKLPLAKHLKSEKQLTVQTIVSQFKQQK